MGGANDKQGDTYLGVNLSKEIPKHCVFRNAIDCCVYDLVLPHATIFLTRCCSECWWYPHEQRVSTCLTLHAYTYT